MHALLQEPTVDTVHITRVITQTLTAWLPASSHADVSSGVESLAAEPPETGDPKWDALIEGAVAYLMHVHALTPPSWTRRTSLEEGGWAPNDIYSDEWHVINVLSTPVELLDKGIVFASENFRRL